MDGARRLLVNGTYSSVTMDDIASEAGVAYQTVYSVFGTKLRLAQAIIASGFHVEGVDELIAQARESSDPEDALRTGARIARRINEPCADLVRFMRESGDPDLLKRHHEMEARRLSDVGFVPQRLESSGRLRPGFSASEVLDMIWAMSGADWYIQLVFQRGWTPSRLRAVARRRPDQPASSTEGSGAIAERSRLVRAPLLMITRLGPGCECQPNDPPGTILFSST